jgi:UDP:flavonoid glycosyltransferase YjiC (YdhE family)
MRIAIVAPGSRGDVQPYVALGKGLLEAGHLVRLVTHEDFETLVDSQGLEFWPIKGKVRDIAQSQDMRALLEKGNFLAIMSQMAKEAQRGAFVMAEAALAACRDMELVLGGIGGLFVGISVAEKLGLPFLQAHYIPFTPTRAYPSFLFHRLPSWLGGPFNRLSYHLVRLFMWQGYRSADRLARQKVLDLPAASFWGPYNSDCTRHYPILYGFSPSVIPPAPDWGDETHVTGYWFLDPPADWTPPPALVEFLQAGPPPVYIGFGSMSNRNPEETTDLVLRALSRAKQRGILLSGWSGLHKANLPDTVYMLDAAPFSWLFPRVSAVVHHGGTGTTAAGLRAGVPSIVTPFFGDQFFWGQRVAQLGAGPEPMPHKKLTVEGLASAIQTALTDQTMRRRAADLGAKIESEDGVARAVAIVDQLKEGSAPYR